MGLEQWGASEQYVAVIHKVLPRKSVFILKNQDYRFLFLREDIKEMEKSNIMTCIWIASVVKYLSPSTKTHYN